jgi:signal transduction histidine kinase
VALLVLLWVATGLTSTYLIHKLYQSQTVPFAENVTTVVAVARMQAAIWQLVLASSANHPASPATIAEWEATFEEHLAEAEATCSVPEEKTLAAEIRKEYAEYRRAARLRSQSSSASPPTVEEAVRLARATFEPCAKLADVNERQLTESATWSARLNKYIFSMRAVFFVLGPLVGVISGYLVARGVHRSISQISVTLRDAASNLKHEVGWVELGASGDLPELHQQIVTISARIKLVMDELHQAREGVLQTTRLAAVGELAAGLAHELRNPLTSVKLLIQTAGQSGSRALTEQQYYVVQDEIVRMESIIQGLLDFARPPTPNRTRHDLRDTLSRALNLVSGRARQQRIMLSWEFPGEPVIVDADAEQLHQVFVNVLLNGIEAIGQKGTLQVLAQREGKRGETCRILFSDSGPGISEQILPRLFEPFATTKEHGTGLGLPISRRIVEEHGGTMLAANRKEGGATITVQLPACPS